MEWTVEIGGYVLRIPRFKDSNTTSVPVLLLLLGDMALKMKTKMKPSKLCLKTLSFFFWPSKTLSFACKLSQARGQISNRY